MPHEPHLLNSVAPQFERRRRQFKFAFFSLLAASAILLVVVLIRNAHQPAKDSIENVQENPTNKASSTSDP
jgi:hypothetical protein